MPIDPAHGRNIPSGYHFDRIVREFLANTRKRFYDQIRQGFMPDFEPQRLTFLAQALAPLYAQQYTTGARFSMNQIGRRDPKFIRIAPQKLDAVASIDLSRAFTLLQPTVPAAANQLSAQFVNVFSETTRQHVRDAVREGIQAGEPLSKIQARLMGIKVERTIAETVEELPVFSRARATAIARTETSRAMHAGQAAYGKSVGSWGLEWLTQSNACSLCLSLGGQERPHGEPFYIWPNAPMPYKYVFHPPAHPNCRCTTIDVFK